MKKSLIELNYMEPVNGNFNDCTNEILIVLINIFPVVVILKIDQDLSFSSQIFLKYNR